MPGKPKYPQFVIQSCAILKLRRTDAENMALDPRQRRSHHGDPRRPRGHHPIQRRQTHAARLRRPGRRIEDLVEGVSELRKLSDRVTRNETRIDTLAEQLQTADAPSPYLPTTPP